MKTFLENYKHNFGSEVRKKPTFYKDKEGKLHKTSEDKWLDYVEWATVLVALYDVAECKSVAFYSKINTEKLNTLTISVVLDGSEYTIDYPIIDGNTILQSYTQLQLHKAELRGFVKCVAIHTGLGLSLWQKEESILNEHPPVEKSPEQKPDNTIEFLEWVDALNNCTTRAELGALYNENKAVIEKMPHIKALFIKKKSEIK